VADRDPLRVGPSPRRLAQLAQRQLGEGAAGVAQERDDRRSTLLERQRELGGGLSYPWRWREGERPRRQERARIHALNLTRGGRNARREQEPRRCAAERRELNNARMAYDEELANRIRELVMMEDGVSEQRMFGGLAFLINGNMSVSASGQRGLMLRVAPADTDSLLRKPHARPFEMRGRSMDGWLRVDAEGVRTKRQLAQWVARGVAYARSLPSKR
jgi:hypothetical protein